MLNSISKCCLQIYFLALIIILEHFLRDSDQWKQNVWSGKLTYCQEDVHWNRLCDTSKYFGCINEIAFYYNIDTEHQQDLLNGISQEDRELYDTFDDEFDCLEQFCPWTPTDSITGETLTVDRTFQIQLFGKSLCTSEDRRSRSVRTNEAIADPEANRCEVDLRTLIDEYLIAHPDQFTLDVFEVEVFDRLSANGSR